MDHLNITFSSPEGSPWLHITVQGKAGGFSHTTQFHPDVPMGKAVTTALQKFLEELAAWTRFMGACRG